MPEFRVSEVSGTHWQRSQRGLGYRLPQPPIRPGSSPVVCCAGYAPQSAGAFARPAVKRGVEVLAAQRKPITDEKAREMLFGAEQYKRH